MSADCGCRWYVLYRDVSNELRQVRASWAIERGYYLTPFFAPWQQWGRELWLAAYLEAVGRYIRERASDGIIRRGTHFRLSAEALPSGPARDLLHALSREVHGIAEKVRYGFMGDEE